MYFKKYWFTGWLRKTEDYEVLGVVASRGAVHEPEGRVHHTIVEVRSRANQ